MSHGTRSRGCWYARSSSQASRGLIQRITSGGTPLPSSHRHASIAVLPPPMTVYPLAGPAGLTRSLTGISRAPGSALKDRVCVIGIEVSRYRASTTRRRTRTVVASPVSRDISRHPSGPPRAQ